MGSAPRPAHPSTPGIRQMLSRSMPAVPAGLCLLGDTDQPHHPEFHEYQSEMYEDLRLEMERYKWIALLRTQSVIAIKEMDNIQEGQKEGLKPSNSYENLAKLKMQKRPRPCHIRHWIR